MSYALSADAETAVVNAPVAARTPNYTGQAVAFMGIAAVPWIPMLAGAWVGGKWDGDDGKYWGAATGVLFSLLTLRYIAKQTAGVIT